MLFLVFQGRSLCRLEDVVVKRRLGRICVLVEEELLKACSGRSSLLALQDFIHENLMLKANHVSLCLLDFAHDELEVAGESLFRL
jgi:hypothetical protein